MIELNHQSYIQPACNKKFHFIYNLSNKDSTNLNRLNLHTDHSGEDVYNFHKPIIELNTLTLRFGNPYDTLSFDTDSLVADISSLGSKTLLSFNKPHKLSVGDIITIDSFTTSEPIKDASIISLLSDKGGLIVDSVNTNSLTVDIDISNIMGNIQPQNVYFESKRFIIKLELTLIA